MNEKEQIRDYIKSNLVVFEEEAHFTDQDNIFAKGFVNSLFAMKLLNFIETNYNIEIADDDINISNFSSIDNILKLINKFKVESGKPVSAGGVE